MTRTLTTGQGGGGVCVSNFVVPLDRWLTLLRPQLTVAVNTTNLSLYIIQDRVNYSACRGESRVIAVRRVAKPNSHTLPCPHIANLRALSIQELEELQVRQMTLDDADDTEPLTAQSSRPRCPTYGCLRQHTCGQEAVACLQQPARHWTSCT